MYCLSHRQTEKCDYADFRALVTSNSYKLAIDALKDLRPGGRMIIRGISNELVYKYLEQLNKFTCGESG